MRIAKRVANMREPDILKYNPLIAAAEAAGKTVYNLAIGQPDLKTPDAFLKQAAAHKGDIHAYALPEGSPELRVAASAYYNRLGYNFSPEDILVTGGGSEALMFALNTVCDPGESVLIPEPFYSVYKDLATALSIHIDGLKTNTESGFDLPDTNTIEEAVTPLTRAVLITHPGNPTGKVYTEGEIKRLIGICKRHNLFLLSDEVYREFRYENTPFESPAFDDHAQENVVILDSISKRYSACGARVGFIASANKAFIKAAKKLCDMRLAVSSSDQAGATALLGLGLDFLDDMLAEYARRRDIVDAFLREIPGVMYRKPSGAFYYMVGLPVDDTDAFMRFMLTEFEEDGETVLLAPAADFYTDTLTGKSEARLAYVLGEDKLSRALTLLKHGLTAYQSRNPNARHTQSPN